MRVLFLIYSLAGGGAERVTGGLANHWARAGHEVTVVVWGSSDKEAEQAYVLDERVTIEILNLGSEPSSLTAALAVNWRRISVIGSVLSARRPDVVIGMMTTASVLLALAGGARDMIRIGTERTYPPLAPMSRAWRLARPIAYARLHAVVAQTEQAADWLRCWTAAQRIEVINNPVIEGGRAGPVVSPISLIPAGARLLLAVGRLVPEKQFDGLIDCFGELARTRPDWHLAILGEGSERERLERRRADSACPECIHLVGRVANVDAWLAHADLFVMSSRFEGFPNSLLEAYCAGVPCISFDCLTGPSTIINNGEDGVLVEPNNFPKLAKALGRLMDHRAARWKLAAAAVVRAGRFEISAIAARWEALFVDLGEHP
jgi:glycosyltransferase involved in cell wall biosynthesis